MFQGITRTILLLTASLGGLASAATETVSEALGESPETSHGMTLEAPTLFSIPLPSGIELPISNSMFMLLLSVVVLGVGIKLATLKMNLIPNRVQNLVEAFFETLYQFVENLIGPKLTRRYFWYFGTVFTMILCCNYMGLLPGVGIFTYTNQTGEVIPIFRGANADMNVTLSLGLFFAVLWFVWSIREQGIKHFLLHLFGPKGDLKGWMRFVFAPIFFFVGLIECLSISIRPIALGARLFGNVFAGESIIETMAHTSGPIISSLCVFPFMMLEILIGFIQALVFLLLTAVFLKLQVGDGDDEHKTSDAPGKRTPLHPSDHGQPVKTLK